MRMDDVPVRPPMYTRILRLKHLRIGGLAGFLLFECMIAAGVLLALAELVTWWAVPVLPAVVAVMVKINDLAAGGRRAASDRARVAETGRSGSYPDPDAYEYADLYAEVDASAGSRRRGEPGVYGSAARAYPRSESHQGAGVDGAARPAEDFGSADRSSGAAAAAPDRDERMAFPVAETIVGDQASGASALGASTSGDGAMGGWAFDDTASRNVVGAAVGRGAVVGGAVGRGAVGRAVVGDRSAAVTGSRAAAVTGSGVVGGARTAGASDATGGARAADAGGGSDSSADSGGSGSGGDSGAGTVAGTGLGSGAGVGSGSGAGAGSGAGTGLGSGAGVGSGAGSGSGAAAGRNAVGAAAMAGRIGGGASRRVSAAQGLRRGVDDGRERRRPVGTIRIALPPRDGRSGPGVATSDRESAGRGGAGRGLVEGDVPTGREARARGERPARVGDGPAQAGNDTAARDATVARDRTVRDATTDRNGRDREVADRHVTRGGGSGRDGPGRDGPVAGQDGPVGKVGGRHASPGQRDVDREPDNVGGRWPGASSRLEDLRQRRDEDVRARGGLNQGRFA